MQFSWKNDNTIIDFKALTKLPKPWLKSNDFGHPHYRTKTANNACDPMLRDRTLYNPAQRLFRAGAQMSR